MQKGCPLQAINFLQVQQSRHLQSQQEGSGYTVNAHMMFSAMHCIDHKTHPCLYHMTYTSMSPTHSA